VADVAELIGPFAEKVENRSLLLDKFVFHKCWPLLTDSDGGDIKWNEASRWSFMRIADGASELLNHDASEKRRISSGPQVSQEKEERLLAEAQIAEKLAKVSWDTKELSTLRARHTRRFLSLFQSKDHAVIIGQLEGRLAINLADSLIQNAGICLDRLFGLPFIPGSAVKGVSRHAALHELKSANAHDQRDLFDLFCLIFGTSDNDFANGQLRPFKHLLSQRAENQKGAIAFLPAYPVNEAKIVVDLTNVHYPAYYRSGQIEKLSEENPRPNPFPAVETGAQFAFCLALNGISQDPKLLPHAQRWLEEALTVHGLGAKTSSGYGWFSLRPEILQQLADEDHREAEAAAAKRRAETEARAKAEQEAARRAAMSPEELAKEHFTAMSQQDFATAVSGVATLGVAEQKGLLLALLNPARRDTWKNWKRSEKPANKARVQALLAVAKTLGMTLP
jgi:CRISPR-associated protein Cmr6